MKELRELKLERSDISVASLELISEGLTQLTKLTLKHNDFDTDMLIPLCKMKNLTDLNLASSCLYREGLELISSMQQLQKLDISRCFSFRGKGVEMLLPLNQLHSLKLNGCCLYEEDFNDLIRFEHVKSLRIRDNNVDYGKMWILAAMKQLQKLDVGANDLYDDEIEIISSAFTQLTSLSIEHGSIELRGVKALCKLTNLKKLRLANNNIELEGFQLLAQSLHHLTHISIEDNLVSTENLPLLNSIFTPSIKLLPSGPRF